MPLPRSGPVRSEAARQSILAATADLLAERGYDHLTIEGIAARAGVGKQTIYRWWPSKAAVIAECLLEGMLLPGQLHLPQTGDIRRDLAAWLGTVSEFLQTAEGDSILRSLIGAAAENAEIGQSLREALWQTDSVAERLAASIGETANLRPGAPVEELAEAFVGAIILRALSRAPLGPDDAERLLDAIVGR